METKKCGRCSEEKAVEDFRWKVKAKSIRHSWCRACTKKHQKEHYDPEHQRQLEEASVDRRRLRVQDGSIILPPSKVCLECSKDKPIEDYRWQDRSRNLKKARCRPCDMSWRARDYRNKSDAYRARIDRLHAELRAIVDEAKKPPCMDCGVSYPPYVMDFDHRDPSQKVAKVSNLMRLGSRTKLEAELAKCDLVCANCHRERTHKQRQT